MDGPKRVRNAQAILEWQPCSSGDNSVCTFPIAQCIDDTQLKRLRAHWPLVSSYKYLVQGHSATRSWLGRVALQPDEARACKNDSGGRARNSTDLWGSIRYLVQNMGLS